MVTKFVPCPDDSGGKQRSLAIARRLAARTDLVLCAYDDGTADTAALEKLGVEVRSVPWRKGAAVAARGAARTRSISAGRFWSAGLADVVRRAAAEEPLDLLQVEYVQMAPFAEGVAATTKVLDLHNVESALAASYARARRPPWSVPFHLEAAALRALERRAVRSFDTVVVVSERERERLRADAGSVVVCPNGIDPPEPLAPATSPTVAFVATMGWAPNTDAALWLGRASGPGWRGGSPTPACCSSVATPRPRSGRWRRPPSTSPARWPTSVPIWPGPWWPWPPCGRGAAPASSSSRPWAWAAPWWPPRSGWTVWRTWWDGCGVVANDAPGIADALVELLKQPGRAADMGRTGHDAVASDHSWDGALAPLLEAESR